MTQYNNPIKELLWQAYVEGFKQSSEGFNGEYPWYKGDEKQQEIRDRIRTGVGGFEDWVESEVENDG